MSILLPVELTFIGMLNTMEHNCLKHPFCCQGNEQVKFKFEDWIP